MRSRVSRTHTLVILLKFVFNAWLLAWRYLVCDTIAPSNCQYFKGTSPKRAVIAFFVEEAGSIDCISIFNDVISLLQGGHRHKWRESDLCVHTAFQTVLRYLSLLTIMINITLQMHAYFAILSSPDPAFIGNRYRHYTSHTFQLRSFIHSDDKEPSQGVEQSQKRSRGMPGTTLR